MQLTARRSNARSHGFARRFLRDDSGAVAIYVTFTTVIMLGFGALVVDLGRLFTLQTELQLAVDASSLAGAAELDGTPGAIARARLAAKDALVNNRETFASGDAEVDFTDADIRFLHSLPASDDDPITAAYVTNDDSAARFVEVRAAARTVDFLLGPVLAHRMGGDGAGPDSGQTSAVAVAGFNQVVCDFPPMMICNPAEVNGNAGAPFDPNVGELIRLKDKGGSGLWGPGNFGLLDPPQGNQGTSQLVEHIASTDPTGCYSSTVDTRTGSAQNPVSKAINVRFDMYENPGFGGNASNDPLYRPSVNVTKGKYKSGNSFVDYEGSPPPGMGMPFHDCLEAGNCDTLGPSFHEDFAPPAPPNNADQEDFWAEYWSINHPGAAGFITMATVGDGTHGPIDVNADGIVTRKEMYDWEIDFGEVPVAAHLNPETDESDSNGENGNPMHYGANEPPDRERRVMPVAVVNCIGDGPIDGNTNDVPVRAFAKMFLSHPAEDGSEQTIYAEVVSVLLPGVDDVLHDIVQLYR